jgi:hypothetical protein
MKQFGYIYASLLRAHRPAVLLLALVRTYLFTIAYLFMAHQFTACGSDSMHPAIAFCLLSLLAAKELGDDVLDCSPSAKSLVQGIEPQKFFF